jgi:hypothetical protein
VSPIVGNDEKSLEWKKHQVKIGLSDVKTSIHVTIRLSRGSMCVCVSFSMHTRCLKNQKLTELFFYRTL